MAGGNSTTTLANLYRPKTFADVVGQPLAVTTLKRIAHADGIAARAIFMKGAFGSGKCQCGTDYVSTSYGYKKFKDIYPDAGYGFTPFEIGVEQPDGSFAQTSHFYKEKDAEVLHLRCASGREYTGTAAHPKLAYRVGSDRVELVKCGDLRVGDYIARRWTGSIELHPDVDEAKLYCLYGVWLGDGHYGNNAIRGLQDSIGYLSCDTLADWCRSVEGYSSSNVVICKNNKCRSYRLSVAKSKLKRFIDGPCVANTKRIHRDAFGSRERAFYTLYGLLITDGYVDKAGMFGFGTVSPYLADGVCDILDYLGLQYSIRKRVGRKYFYKKISEWRPAQDSYRISISVESSHALYDAMLAYVSILEMNAPHSRRLVDGFAEYFSKRPINSTRNNKNCVLLGSYASEFVSVLRGVRRSLPVSSRQKYDSMSRILGRIARSKTTSVQAIEHCAEYLIARGSELPANIATFCGVRFDRIESISTTVEDVYDVTVPSTHLFMSGNVVNHNTTTARIFARALNCDTFKQTGDVCNTCDGCLEASSVNSSTYWELDGTVIGNVEGIRALKERLSIVPNGRRVVCLDEVQSCTRSANDALLKVVEEGVPNTIFLFCGTEDIQPTLKSRCVNIDISVIPLSLIADRVRFIANDRGISITDDQLRILAMKSQGHMRDALQLLQFYELAGERALDSSYFLFREFVRSCFAKGADPSSVLPKLLVYSTADIKMSVGLLIRNIFGSAQDDSLESKFQRAGLGRTLFSFFFSPLAQQALGSEIGTEILLRSLMERTAGSRKM